MVWAGLSVVVVAVLSYLGLAFIARRTYPTVLFDGAILVGLLLAVIGWASANPTVLPWVTVAISVAWFVLSRRELRLTRSGLRVRVGDPLPEFTVLAAADGSLVTSRDLAAAAPALLVVYRGVWCPYCTTQLDEIRREHSALAAAGCRVFALSVDPPEHARLLEQRLGGMVTMLCDLSGEALDALGVRDPQGAAWYDRLLLGAPDSDIAAPAAIVVGSDGRVRMAYRSPRIDIRVSTAAVLKSLERVGPAGFEPATDGL